MNRAVFFYITNHLDLLMISAIMQNAVRVND